MTVVQTGSDVANAADLIVSYAETFDLDQTLDLDAWGDIALSNNDLEDGRDE
jgi:hypothetical protein